jgi:hypothetical protein
VAEDLDEVSQPFEDRPVPLTIAGLDEARRVILLEVCGEDLRSMADSLGAVSLDLARVAVLSVASH